MDFLIYLKFDNWKPIAEAENPTNPRKGRLTISNNPISSVWTNRPDRSEFDNLKLKTKKKQMVLEEEKTYDSDWLNNKILWLNESIL